MARAKQGKKGSVKQKKKPIQFQIGWGGLAAIIASTLCILMWIFVLGFWVGQKIVGSGLKTAPDVTVLARTSQPPTIDIPAESSIKKGKAALAVMKDTEEIPTETIPARPENKFVETAAVARVDKEKINPLHEEAKSQAEKEEKKSEAGEPVKKAAVAEKVVTEKNVPARKKAAVHKEKKVEAKPSGPFVTLQIASFQDRGKAMREADRWRRKGYDATYKRADLGKKGVWFRVYAGQYPTVEKAKAAARKIAAKEHVTPYVRSVK